MNVILIAALTADGFIGRDSGHTADWTGREDKKVFVRLTKQAGVMIMGSKTLTTIGRALPGRRTIVYSRHPDNIQIDGVETTSEAPAELLQRLQAEGQQSVAICGGSEIYTLFMQAGLVTEMYLTVVPVLFGSGVSLLTQPANLSLQLADCTQLADDCLLLHYRVKQQ